MKDKKLDLLIRAMSRVCAEREAHLLMVGVGTERPHLERLIRRLNLAPYVHLLGPVPERDLPGSIAPAACLPFPPWWKCRACPPCKRCDGLPIVAANSAALPELVRNGENGFLVNPLDADELGKAILSILNHPDVARRMGQVSLSIGRAHDERITFQAYEDLYRRMAGL